MKKILAILLTVVLLCTGLASCAKPTYADLAIVDLGLEREYFGIAFRSGSDMTRKVEDITLQLIDAGVFEELSAKYEVSGVGKGEYTPKAEAYTDSGDWAYIQGKGKLVIGITDYKPMDYKDENGEWIGFDADYARKVCEKLGVTPEFKEIEWENKEMALESKDIDCIWNGMTITDAIESVADCTAPYMYNMQVAVVKKANVDKYKTINDLAGVSIAAEGGSAGAKVIEGNEALKGGFKSVSAQTDALLEVLSGASEAAIVDNTLAKALIKD